MRENRYEYQRQITPQQPDTWDNFISRLQDIRVIGISPSWERLNPKEAISADLKKQIFETPTQNLRNFLERRDIATPRDNLTDRLMVVNNHDYNYLCIVDKSDPTLGSLGTRLSNRLCIVNADAISRKASREKANFEDLIRIVGTHEIVHTTTYQERWSQGAPNESFTVGQGQARNFRRDGIGTQKPFFASPIAYDQAFAFSDLAEGFIQYITLSCLSLEQYEPLRQHDSYAEITESVKTMIGQIGEKPFIQATFTREGFRELHKAVETRYGKGQFRTLLQTVNNGTLQPLPLHERLRAQGFIP